MIHAKVPVKRGKVISEGDYAIDGVPGTGAKIELSFMDPGGALTGRLLPTGNAVDEIVLETGEKFFVTIVDAGNPTAFVLSEALGLKGTELPEFLEETPEMKRKLEAIRKKVGELGHIPFTPSIPKIAFVAVPQDYRTIAGRAVRRDEVNILARLMAMGKLHKAFAITAGVPAAAASVVPGSVVHKVISGTGDDPMERRLVIGHPSGQMDVGVKAKKEEGQIRIVSCTIGRTARKIMEGRVYISNKVYQRNHEE
jgi:2-methylaconitate cis-trans-isomerase PrpF